GHAHDFDDTNFALLGHPSVPLLSTALAAAEAEMAAGRALVLGYIIGFEIDVALGTALNPDHYTRGWHATPSIGTLGCAAATALEGKQGYAAAFGGAHGLDQALESLGRTWHLLSSGIAVKPYPSCALTHSAIDALIDLRTEHRLSAGNVAGVQVGVNRVVPDVLAHSRPTTARGGIPMRRCPMPRCARNSSPAREPFCHRTKPRAWPSRSATSRTSRTSGR